MNAILRRFPLAFALALTTAGVTYAQWLKVTLPDTPRNADGTPNVTAPTPRTPDGKPDLSGIWRRIGDDQRLMLNLGDGNQEMQMQAAAGALYAKRSAGGGAGRPSERCLPDRLGYSVAKWEGDALIAETVGLNEQTWLDVNGHPHSDALRLTERFHRIDFGHMQVQFTIDDPKMYKQPWSATLRFELLPDTELIENICENEKDATHIAEGAPK